MDCKGSPGGVVWGLLVGIDVLSLVLVPVGVDWARSFSCVLAWKISRMRGAFDATLCPPTLTRLLGLQRGGGVEDIPDAEHRRNEERQRRSPSEEGWSLLAMPSLRVSYLAVSCGVVCCALIPLTPLVGKWGSIE